MLEELFKDRRSEFVCCCDVCLEQLMYITQNHSDEILGDDFSKNLWCYTILPLSFPTLFHNRLSSFKRTRTKLPNLDLFNG